MSILNSNNNMWRIQIRLFGAFRNFSENHEIELEVPLNCSLGDLKACLMKRLSDDSRRDSDALPLLMDRSVFASEADVLRPTDVLQDGMRLAILPPVCGG